MGRAVASGLIAGLVEAAAIAVLGGGLAITAGLLAIAGLGGWGVAVAVRTGGRSAIERRTRIAAAVALAVAGVVVGQAGLWAYGRIEGGVLGPLDYLAEVWGLLVPLQLAFAGVAAWLSSR